MTSPATYAACLTPDATGAIATIALRGPRALEIVGPLFRSASPPVATAHQGTIQVGTFGDDLADQVVLHLKQDTPLPWIELHCHGGREVVRLLLQALEAHGAAFASWQEFTAGIEAHPLSAAAALQLAAAPTARTAAILLDQHQGACERMLGELATALERHDRQTALQLLADLTSRTALGRHLTLPWRVVVAGAPNTGKSSLVNALAGYQRSIVSGQAGTTRDVVSVRIALDGWPVELYDTAGLREAASSLEQQGIRLAEAALADADVCLWVLDGSAAAPGEIPTEALLGQRPLVVINKIDEPAGWDHGRAPPALRVSAKTGEGLAALGLEIASLLVPEPPPAGAAVPFTAELCARLQAVAACVQAGNLDAAHRLLVAGAVTVTAPSA